MNTQLERLGSQHCTGRGLASCPCALYSDSSGTGLRQGQVAVRADTLLAQHKPEQDHHDAADGREP